MAVIKYTPFPELETFPTGLRLFQDTVNRLFAEPNARPWVPPVDIKETENELIFKADIPDIEMKDIDVHMENGTLTLRGERKFEETKDGGGWHRVERSYGTFERVFALPETVDPEAVKADYKNGVLTIMLPKKEVAKPRQIKVEFSKN
ncbi:MAG TPA: Hsp20/alpha crystallin family protein [Bryobacteraceae bacterium]|jgi:HSP20 family protein|nr:Hsp20/alpha crystallin family protein [Bryobacteraceae bacterium]